jgi:hypothetical protein
VGAAEQHPHFAIPVQRVERTKALDVVRLIALDSVPPLRRAAYEYLRFECKDCLATTTQVAAALELPSGTVRRALEELAAYGVVKRSRNKFPMILRHLVLSNVGADSVF